jgi:hypothetical protein
MEPETQIRGNKPCLTVQKCPEPEQKFVYSDVSRFFFKGHPIFMIISVWIFMIISVWIFMIIFSYKDDAALKRKKMFSSQL